MILLSDGSYRKLKVGGKKRDFAMLGFTYVNQANGANKASEIQRAARFARANGYYARVIPIAKDRAMSPNSFGGAPRWGLFVASKPVWYQGRMKTTYPRIETLRSPGLDPDQIKINFGGNAGGSIQKIVRDHIIKDRFAAEYRFGPATPGGKEFNDELFDIKTNDYVRSFEQEGRALDYGANSGVMIYNRSDPEETIVEKYVDEMTDDRSHGNEYLASAALKVQAEMETGKIAKDMKIVKQKIAEYMDEAADGIDFVKGVGWTRELLRNDDQMDVGYGSTAMLTDELLNALMTNDVMFDKRRRVGEEWKLAGPNYPEINLWLRAQKKYDPTLNMRDNIIQIVGPFGWNQVKKAQRINQEFRKAQELSGELLKRSRTRELGSPVEIDWHGEVYDANLEGFALDLKELKDYNPRYDQWINWAFDSFNGKTNIVERGRILNTLRRDLLSAKYSSDANQLDTNSIDESVVNYLKEKMFSRKKPGTFMTKEPDDSWRKIVNLPDPQNPQLANVQGKINWTGDQQ